MSVHRGGARKGFPVNCLPTFASTLNEVHTLLEIDPPYTKDSAHDPTLDRTSTGHGRVSDHTLLNDTTLLNGIHKRGAMCILGSSRNYTN